MRIILQIDLLLADGYLKLSRSFTLAAIQFYDYGTSFQILCPCVSLRKIEPTTNVRPAIIIG